ncbi:oxidoreductase [Ferruginibacter lapsinanis]|uniref:WD40/YVTN/BNR-like repeat-containing protein n=1 Tax=Ferruginibacter lapsinanis TaxID=563172 RepID=UPI001E61AD16|nr:oxidoreductase [Ferruginibacter lapsinanis]UEG48761.1 oxidoreductase [Ferruginibacter lapsinanis]
MQQKFFYTLFFSFLIFFSKAQTIQTIDSIGVSLRGLSVVNDKVIWVSGSMGAVGRSVDSGNTWKWYTVEGFEKNDFRDIEAFDETSAVIMGTGEPAYILRTADGGETWKVVFEDNTKGMFLDAMEFWNENSGIVVGDPIDGKFFVGRTFDGGFTWRGIPPENYPPAEQGEVCFAASGTNVRKLGNAEAVFVSGGKTSSIFIRDKIIELPFEKDKETAGANSVAVKNKKIMAVVGGDFMVPDSTTKNCFITKDAGNKWVAPKIPPHGYRSCIEYIDNKKWISCGLNGVDYSIDEGVTWKWISKEGYNVCRKSANGNTVFLAGDGIIGKLVY